MYRYIYLATNLITQIKYLGKHKYNKPEIDPEYYGSGILFRRDLNKYGAENIVREILSEVDGVPTICETEEELNASEFFYSIYYNVVESNEYYNLIYGGSSGNTWGHLDTESLNLAVQKRLNTLALMPNVNGRTYIGNCIYNGRQRMSEEDYQLMCSNISKSLNGTKKSLEHCKHIRETRIARGTAKGSKNPNFVKTTIFKDNKESHIYDYEIDTYIQLGYLLGRPAEINRKAGDATRGTFWYHNEFKAKRIKADQIQAYIDSGYLPGRY